MVDGARTASCSCGQLSITVSGEPQVTLVCHCRDCQKATGSPFGVSTYWPISTVENIRGESRSYTRIGAARRKLTHHFCPACGGRLFWYAEYFSEMIGVALGNFDSQDLPAPTDEYWTLRKLPWIGFNCNLSSHVGDD